ncbi:MAG TPA: phosphate ABC transporter permease PstA [Solirubrobacteraceae bacterium]|nr:phosphate ABC transporter permease PstA [Solirubrobacteraceae bacterium]
MTAVGHVTERHASLPDPAAPLTASGNLRRRVAVSRVITALASASALFAVALLADVIYTVIHNGAPVLSLGFLTQNSNGLAGGGIANALLGTVAIVVFAAVIALPVGVLTGLYLTEFAGPRSRTASALKLVLDLLQGLPTIIVGVVVYGLIVAAEHQETGLAGSVALAIVMLPMIARSSQEVLLLVPGNLREAADALGVERWRAVVSVILPAAAGGIATGAILSIARAAGETAPLLVVDSLYNPNQTQLMLFGHGVPSIPMYIYTTYDLPAPSAIARAWGAALVLLSCILMANVGARLLLARSQARVGAR